MVFAFEPWRGRKSEEWNQGHAEAFSSLHLALLRKPGRDAGYWPLKYSSNDKTDLTPGLKNCPQLFSCFCNRAGRGSVLKSVFQSFSLTAGAAGRGAAFMPLQRTKWLNVPDILTGLGRSVSFSTPHKPTLNEQSGAENPNRRSQRNVRSVRQPGRPSSLPRQDQAYPDDRTDHRAEHQGKGHRFGA